MTSVLMALAAFILVALLVPRVRVWLTRRFWRVVDTLGLLKPRVAGDGVTDDTQAVQLRLNRTGRAHLPPGRYRMRSTLTMPRDSSLRGASFDEGGEP